MNCQKYPIVPVAKPRMTRSDKWKQRPIVMRYRAFKDEIRLHKVTLPESGSHIVFYLPMPESWTAKKKLKLCGEAHLTVPYLDNLIKALLDALFTQDSHIWHYTASKLWAKKGAIHILT